MTLARNNVPELPEILVELRFVNAPFVVLPTWDFQRLREHDFLAVGKERDISKYTDIGVRITR